MDLDALPAPMAQMLVNGSLVDLDKTFAVAQNQSVAAFQVGSNKSTRIDGVLADRRTATSNRLLPQFLDIPP